MGAWQDRKGSLPGQTSHFSSFSVLACFLQFLDGFCHIFPFVFPISLNFQQFIFHFCPLDWKRSLTEYGVAQHSLNSLLPVGRYINMDPSLSGLLISWTQSICFGQFFLDPIGSLVFIVLVSQQPNLKIDGVLVCKHWKSVRLEEFRNGRM